MRRTACLAIACLAAGCGKGNSKVTDQGNTLAPQSAVMFSENAFFISVGGVMVTDVSGACDTIGKAAQSANACNSSGSGSFPGPQTATSLVIAMIPAGEGKFSILQQNSGSSTSPDGGVSITFPTGAVVEFQKTVNSKVTFTDQAVSGTVNVDHFKFGDSASGSYDVVMQSGAHLTGDFNANDCPALDQAFAQSSSSDKSCDFQGGGSGASVTCGVSCSCGGKTVSSSCSESDGGAWSCTCKDASGATTTCTEPAGTVQSNVCSDSPGQGCCPMTF